MKTYIGLPDGTNERVTTNEASLIIGVPAKDLETYAESVPNGELDGMIVDQYIFMVDKRKR